MAWFAVHVVMRVAFAEGPPEPIAVWENCVLIEAENHDGARAAGARIGALEAGASRAKMTWQGRPARWEYVGVRKVQIIDADRFQDGLEISHMEYEVATESDLLNLASGVAVNLTYIE